MSLNQVLGYAPEEAFRKLGISRALGYKLIKNGTIRAVRIGERRLIIPIAVLEKMLEVGND